MCEFYFLNFYKASFFFFLGCSASSSKTPSSLLHAYPSCMHLSKIPHVDLQAKGLLVFPSLDALYFLGLSPRARRYPPWTLVLSIWKYSSCALLAVRSNHCIITSPLFSTHVPDRHQGNDFHKARHCHRCVNVLGYELSECLFPVRQKVMCW